MDTQWGYPKIKKEWGLNNRWIHTLIKKGLKILPKKIFVMLIRENINQFFYNTLLQPNYHHNNYYNMIS